MADTGDMKAHEQTFSGVMGLLKWGIVGVALVAILVIILITN